MKPDDEQDEQRGRQLPVRPRAPEPVRSRRGVEGTPRSSSSGGLFDNAVKAAKDLDGQTQITVPVDEDAKGYFDRECPAVHCEYQFKVHLQDWKQQVADKVYCPMCGTHKGSGSWWTKGQLEVAKAHAKQHLEQILYGAFALDADRLNSSRQDGLIKMSMKVTVPEKKNLPPIPSSDAYRLEIQCEHCRFRFSVLGSAYFCPCCGRSSVERAFTQSISTMRTKIKNARQFRNDLTKAGKPDEAVDIERDLIESCVKDCVTDFQCLCDALWSQKRPTEKTPKNAFQRLQQGSDLWRIVSGEGYDDWLGAPRLGRLLTFFQRRHLLSHADGIVDQEYLDRSGDTTYAKGQRIVVSVAEAEEMVALIEELATRLRTKLASIP